MLGIETKVGNLESDLKELKGYHPYIKRALLDANRMLTVTDQKVEQILEDQKSIHEILGDHEVSIRTLRRNPV